VFNSPKGYGFIAPVTGGADVFVHISAVDRVGIHSLREGQRLSFEIERGQMARPRRNVCACSSSARLRRNAVLRVVGNSGSDSDPSRWHEAQGGCHRVGLSERQLTKKDPAARTGRWERFLGENDPRFGLPRMGKRG
jgi:CspA family cold shock protein